MGFWNEYGCCMAHAVSLISRRWHTEGLMERETGGLGEKWSLSEGLV